MKKQNLSKLKKAAAFLFALLFIFSINITAMCDETAVSNTGSKLFGYNTVVTEAESQSGEGIFMWGLLIAAAAILIICAFINVYKIKKEEKMARSNQKPRLIIKKGYKN